MGKPSFVPDGEKPNELPIVDAPFLDSPPEFVDLGPLDDIAEITLPEPSLFEPMDDTPVAGGPVEGPPVEAPGLVTAESVMGDGDLLI